MEYVVFIEGQKIPIPPEMGESDEAVKNAMRPIFPEVANAQFTRTEKDGVTTITVIKKAGSKGGWQDLISATEGRNPIIALQAKLADTNPSSMTMEELIEADEQINTTLEAGDSQKDMVGYALHRLKKAKAAALSVTPVGF